METLTYGNNEFQANQSRARQSGVRKTLNNWLIISPQQIVLHGMLLTANFNIENAHEHLSVNFKIKSFLKGREAPFVEVFPQKGNIMRGEIKKFRVKFTKQFQPQIGDNGSMKLKVYVNLNTEWNKQYMITNKLRGWNEIKDLPIEEYEVPIMISDEYTDIKQNIRNSVLFQSEFGKVSQDMSSLYGQEKFDINEAHLPSRGNLVKSRQKQRFTQAAPFYSPKRPSHSQKKGSRTSIQSGSGRKQVYFGNGPRMIQSKIQFETSMSRQRPGSAKKLYRRDPGILQINTPTRDKDVFYEINPVKKVPQIKNPFINQGQLFQHFSQQRLPQRVNKPREPSGFPEQDSEMSILKSLESRNSRVQRYDFQSSKNHDQNKPRVIEPSVFKEYQTVDNHFVTTIADHQQPHANKRSMELIVLAIISGFFVALGSNIGSLFS